MRRPFVLVLLLGVLAVTGCGSSASNSADTARFVTQLDTLCTQGNAAVRGTHSISVAADTFQRYLDKVKALTPADRLKPTFSKFTSLLDQRLGL